MISGQQERHAMANKAKSKTRSVRSRPKARRSKARSSKARRSNARSSKIRSSKKVRMLSRNAVIDVFMKAGLRLGEAIDLSERALKDEIRALSAMTRKSDVLQLADDIWNRIDYEADEGIAKVQEIAKKEARIPKEEAEDIFSSYRKQIHRAFAKIDELKSEAMKIVQGYGPHWIHNASKVQDLHEIKDELRAFRAKILEMAIQGHGDSTTMANRGYFMSILLRIIFEESELHNIAPSIPDIHGNESLDEYLARHHVPREEAVDTIRESLEPCMRIERKLKKPLADVMDVCIARSVKSLVRHSVKDQAEEKDLDRRLKEMKERLARFKNPCSCEIL